MFITYGILKKLQVFIINGQKLRARLRCRNRLINLKVKFEAVADVGLFTFVADVS